MTHVAPRNPKTNAKTKPLTWAEFEEIWRTGAQLADPTDTVPQAAEIKAKVAEWSQLSVTHGKALFRRIRNQSEVFTEADREELMDFANKAVTGGMMLASLQEGGRRATARHTRAKNSRDGNIAKAATWHAIVEELAVNLWIKDPKFHGSASNTAHEIYDDLKSAYPKAPKPGTVAKHLSEANVQERMSKKICSSS